MRRKSSGLRVLHLVWVACLLVPPAVRLSLDHVREAGGGREVVPWTSNPALSHEEATARLGQAERDLRALDVTPAHEDYEPVLARVLPVRDPSASRSALYVGIRSLKPIPDDITALTVDHRLLGRVMDVISPLADSGGFAVAQVMTILDPSFRVPFVAGETRGLAGGLGATTEEGHALLEVIFLDGPGSLEEGQPVLTDSARGVIDAGIAFAPGLPIGFVIPDTEGLQAKRRSRLPLIRSEVVVERQLQAVLLRDSMRLSRALIQERKS